MYFRVDAFKNDLQRVHVCVCASAHSAMLRGGNISLLDEVSRCGTCVSLRS